MAQTMITESRGRLVLGYAACGLAGCLWGTGFFFGKIALTEMGVAHMVLYRFLFACVAMAPLVWRHPARLSGAEWRMLLLALAASLFAHERLDAVG